jgi:hypothetical protein
MKILPLTVTCILLLFILSTGCKETSKSEKEVDKSIILDTVKKNINYDSMVTVIQKFRDEEELKLRKGTLKKNIIELNGDKIKESIKQKWERLEAYYDGDRLVRMQLYPHKGLSERTEEFYIREGKLAFVSIQDKGPKHEGSDTGEPGKEIYFDNGKLIKYSNTAGEEIKNIEEEKRMYEARLPYEVNELREIINSQK